MRSTIGITIMTRMRRRHLLPASAFLVLLAAATALNSKGSILPEVFEVESRYGLVDRPPSSTLGDPMEFVPPVENMKYLGFSDRAK